MYLFCAGGLADDYDGFKPRIDWPVFKEEIEAEIVQTLTLLIDLDLLPVGSEALMSEGIALFPIGERLSLVSNADLVLEAAPETEVAKKRGVPKVGQCPATRSNCSNYHLNFLC